MIDSFKEEIRITLEKSVEARYSYAQLFRDWCLIAHEFDTREVKTKEDHDIFDSLFEKFITSDGRRRVLEVRKDYPDLKPVNSIVRKRVFLQSAENLRLRSTGQRQLI